MKNKIENLKQSESEQMKKLKEIVNKSIEEEQLLVENLFHHPLENLTIAQRISDKVASFGGSWKFIIVFSFMLAIWILFNTLSPRKDEFDPYPFILMNLVLSAVAALQAPIIMMSQNRKEEIDRKRSENDYLINLKSELEVRNLHQKMDLLLEEQMKVLFESQVTQLELIRSIKAKLDSK